MDEDRIDRNTRAFEDLMVAIREFRLTTVQNTRVLQQLADEIDDQRGEIRAQTRAILTMLDRWGSGPAAA